MGSPRRDGMQLARAAAATGKAPSPARLSVVMVTPRFLPLIGGVEVHVREVSRRLLARGLTVLVITGDAGGQLPERECVDGIDVRRLPEWPARTDLHYLRGLGAAIRDAAPDVVHVQGIHTLAAPFAMLAARRAKVPYVVTFHTGGHPSRFRQLIRPLQWRLLAPLLRQAGALIAVSRFEARLFQAAIGDTHGQIVVIRNGGVSLGPADREKIAVDPSLVVSIGRLEWYKGHHRAIDALPALRESIPDAHLLILGSGQQETKLLERAAGLGMARAVKVRSIPASRRDELSDIVASAGVVVLLSEYESHPVAAMEAISLGRPVVVAATTGLIELAETGLVRAVPLKARADELAAVLTEELRTPTPITGPLPTWEHSVAQLASVYRRMATAS